MIADIGRLSRQLCGALIGAGAIATLLTNPAFPTTILPPINDLELAALISGQATMNALVALGVATETSIGVVSSWQGTLGKR